MSDGIDVPTAELLRNAYVGPVGGLEGVDEDPTYKAQLALYARTQHAFYVAFQAVVLVLALATLGALVVFVARLVGGIDVVGGVDVAVLISAIGTLVSGGAAVFLQKQASEAKDRYVEALKLWKES